jgi:hypothetical protein
MRCSRSRVQTGGDWEQVAIHAALRLSRSHRLTHTRTHTHCSPPLLVDVPSQYRLAVSAVDTMLRTPVEAAARRHVRASVVVRAVVTMMGAVVWCGVVWCCAVRCGAVVDVSKAACCLHRAFLVAS